jgi:hypothetical protein
VHPTNKFLNYKYTFQIIIILIFNISFSYIWLAQDDKTTQKIYD